MKKDRQKKFTLFKQLHEYTASFKDLEFKFLSKNSIKSTSYVFFKKELKYLLIHKPLW